MPVLNAITPVSQVLRVGDRCCIEVTDDLLASLAQNDRHLAVLRDLGFSSMMIVPIAARGRILVRSRWCPPSRALAIPR